MTAFVAGATGFVGREVVRQPGARGAQVVAHVRPDSTKLADWTARFTAMGAEVSSAAWTVDALADALRATQADGGFILIGTTKGRARGEGVTGDPYAAIDLRLTAMLVEAAQQAGTRPRLVLLSSVGADATARSAYLAARGQADEVVMGSGLPWLIARPSMISGPGRDDARTGERVASAVADGLLKTVGLFGAGRLRDKYRSNTPDVLGAALIRLGEVADVNRIVDGAELH